MSNSSSDSVRVWNLRRISWLTIILALFAIGTFIVIENDDSYYRDVPVSSMEGSPYPTRVYDGMPVPPPMMQDIQQLQITQAYPIPMGGQMGEPLSYGSSSYGVSVADTQSAYPYPYRNPEISAVDTREFLKVRYDANMRTRNVQGLTHRVEATVREHNGRVDNAQSSSQAGYVSFVIPMSKYEAFRAEIEKLVGSRFISVNIQSENLLPQKQSIEEQQKQADTSLAQYKTARTAIVDNHLGAIKNLQAQLEREAAQLASLRIQTQTPEILAQIAGIQDDVAALREALFNENATYKEQIGYADANIKGAQEWQSSVKIQDKTLADNVGTVSGSVSVQWISMWDIALLYLPGYWIPAIFAVLSFLSYLWDRRRFVAWEGSVV